MNGEIKELHDLLMTRMDKTDIKQDKRHEENLKTFGKLPCKLHGFIITTLLSIFTSGVVITIIVIAVRKVMET